MSIYIYILFKIFIFNINTFNTLNFIYVCTQFDSY